MNEELFVTGFDGTKIYVKKQVKESDKAILVMMHGLGEYAGTFSYAAQKMNDAGIGTYQPEHRGHGHSEGEPAYCKGPFDLVDDFRVTVRLALEENPNRPVFLYGHSMGGYTVSLYGAKYPNQNIRGIITSGAVVEDNQKIFKSAEKGLDPYTRFPNNLMTEICSVLERVKEFRADPMSTLFHTAGLSYALTEGIDWFSNHMQDVTYPIFITHGEKDPVVSVQDSYNFYKKVGAKDHQLKIYGECHHAIFNEFCRDEVLDDYISWINYRIS